MIPFAIPGLPWAKIIIVLAIVGTITAGYFYVNNLQDRLVETERANLALEIRATTAEQNAENAIESMKKAILHAKETDTKMQTIRAERDEAKKIVDDSNRLARLALAKPGLISNRARAATDRLYQEFEDLSRRNSGADLHGASDGRSPDTPADPSNSN